MNRMQHRGPLPRLQLLVCSVGATDPTYAADKEEETSVAPGARGMTHRSDLHVVAWNPLRLTLICAEVEWLLPVIVLHPPLLVHRLKHHSFNVILI